ncbi:hypothetical protein [uncultured Tateyamaria sp.]|uniref:hypothetical protein n=1 Tax=uncultured Tateyamaria sp. TaxID=455651 RepID=UPI0026132CC0|nr:hypothetical protein [uncultured Tateyamaria sp.]
MSRFKRAISAGRQAVDTSSNDDAPGQELHKISWALIHLDDTTTAEHSLDEHQAICERSGFRSLVISNMFPPTLINRPEVIFEYLPLDMRSSLDEGAGTATSEEYLMARLEHITQFWQVVGCTWHGNRASEVRSIAAKRHGPESVFAA